MTPSPFGRPADDEYAPYYQRYVHLVPTDDLVGFARDQIATVTGMLGSVSEEKARLAYAPGKWTLKEVVGHLFDTERVFEYRAMSIARADPAPLPGFDQELWVPNGGFNDRSFASLLDEWTLVRRAHVAFLEGLSAQARSRAGLASDNQASVRALAYVPSGHTAYHLGIIRERYL